MRLGLYLILFIICLNLVYATENETEDWISHQADVIQNLGPTGGGKIIEQEPIPAGGGGGSYHPVIIEEEEVKETIVVPARTILQILGVIAFIGLLLFGWWITQPTNK